MNLQYKMLSLASVEQDVVVLESSVNEPQTLKSHNQDIKKKKKRCVGNERLGFKKEARNTSLS